MRSPIKVMLMRTFLQRLRGLEFRKRDDVNYMFSNCNCIHTFGMRKPIDVAFTSSDGRVLQVNRGVGARKILRSGGAVNTIERFSSDAHWLVPGERYDFEEI